MGKNRYKYCRVWDDTYPHGKEVAKIKPSTIFGPIEELRSSSSIDRKMYIVAKVPPMAALGPEFRYVNVAFYDHDEKKMIECCKVCADTRFIMNYVTAKDNPVLVFLARLAKF